MIKGPKSEEYLENSVRSKAIRHLIWLGNTLRHGNNDEMTSPDHRDLLEAIGNENSSASTKSPSSASNLSSLNFNLSLKHQIPICEEASEATE